MVVVPAAVIHGILGITPTWESLEAAPRLPEGWRWAEADVLYKGRRHRVRIEGEKVRIEPLAQVIHSSLLWVMDANLASSPGRAATGSNVDFADGSLVTLKPAAKVAPGTYQSPPCDWGVAARLAELIVAVDLHGGSVTATVETSNDGFRTIRSEAQIALQEGVNTYPLADLRGASRAVRVRFKLDAGRGAAARPVIDAFRVTGRPANERPGR
jgi:hypothetical protein